jgi:hypothetical protein
MAPGADHGVRCRSRVESGGVDSKLVAAHGEVPTRAPGRDGRERQVDVDQARAGRGAAEGGRGWPDLTRRGTGRAHRRRRGAEEAELTARARLEGLHRAARGWWPECVAGAVLRSLARRGFGCSVWARPGRGRASARCRRRRAGCAAPAGTLGCTR